MVTTSSGIANDSAEIFVCPIAAFRVSPLYTEQQPQILAHLCVNTKPSDWSCRWTPTTQTRIEVFSHRILTPDRLSSNLRLARGRLPEHGVFLNLLCCFETNAIIYISSSFKQSKAYFQIYFSKVSWSFLEFSNSQCSYMFFIGISQYNVMTITWGASRGENAPSATFGLRMMSTVSRVSMVPFQVFWNRLFCVENDSFHTPSRTAHCFRKADR